MRNYKEHGGGRLFLDGVSFLVQAWAIVGIIGSNGAGKTTLFRILVGGHKPDSGELFLGETGIFSYVNQRRSSLEPGKVVYEVISGGRDIICLGDRELNARDYCPRFNFLGADQQNRWMYSPEASATACIWLVC